MPNRAQTRTALATLLSAHLPMVQTIYRYPKRDLAGESPLITLNDGGSERQRQTLQGGQSRFAIDINVFVLQSGDGWTEEQAEDTLAAIEAHIAAIVDSYRRHEPHWALIDYDGRTTPRPLAQPGGVVYLWEVVTVVATLF